MADSPGTIEPNVWYTASELARRLQFPRVKDLLAFVEHDLPGVKIGRTIVFLGDDVIEILYRLRREQNSKATLDAIHAPATCTVEP